jgi:hypothetical protein
MKDDTQYHLHGNFFTRRGKKINRICVFKFEEKGGEGIVCEAPLLYFAAVPTLFRRLNHYTASSQKPVPNPNHSYQVYHSWMVMPLRASSCNTSAF